MDLLKNTLNKLLDILGVKKNEGWRRVTLFSGFLTVTIGFLLTLIREGGHPDVIFWLTISYFFLWCFVVKSITWISEGFKKF